ncbi:hypothetical protein V8C86DRAFT_3022132 [Haematococcus lacustris]
MTGNDHHRSLSHAVVICAPHCVQHPPPPAAPAPSNAVMGLFNWFFAKACRIVFDRVDHNRDGHLEEVLAVGVASNHQPLEVEIAVLELYNIFNKRLPGWVDPPRRAEIQAALRNLGLCPSFTTPKYGSRQKERLSFMSVILSCRDDLEIRNGDVVDGMRCDGCVMCGSTGGKAALTTAILPALGFALHTSLPLTRRIPLAVLAPVLGNLAGVARMLFRLCPASQPATHASSLGLPLAKEKLGRRM